MQLSDTQLRFCLRPSQRNDLRRSFLQTSRAAPQGKVVDSLLKEKLLQELRAIGRHAGMAAGRRHRPIHWQITKAVP